MIRPFHRVHLTNDINDERRWGGRGGGWNGALQITDRNRFDIKRGFVLMPNEALSLLLSHA